MRTHLGERGNYAPEFVMIDTLRPRTRVDAVVATLLALLDEMNGDAHNERTRTEQFANAADETESDAEWWLGATEDANERTASEPETFDDLKENGDDRKVAYAPV